VPDGSSPRIDTPGAAARAAARLYASAPLGARALARLRPWICPFERLVPLVPVGARVLDVGCGSGLLLGLLARAGRLAGGVGIDADLGAIAAAEAMRTALPPPLRARLRFARQDAEAPWPAEPFTVVALIDVLHHLPPSRQHALIERALLAVEPGGMLLYKDMAARPRWRAAANRAHDLLMARQWVHHRALAEVEAWAAAAGFACAHRARIARGPYGHELAVFRRVAP
jgi:2-polyprenyl-3-methyl-5-hydroxy-6-metoxy-1,4-benzoquinol methylase